MSELLITLRLYLTQPEITSLLMAQITQARHSRLTLGESNSTTRVDRTTLEKLVLAHQRAVTGRTE